MILFNPERWFWIVGSDQSKVWSSERAGFVDTADPLYSEWLSAGNSPTSIVSLDELAVVLRTAYPAGMLSVYLAAKRFAVETGGITVGGQVVATDRESQGLVNGAYNLVLRKPDTEISFKTGSGFVQLNAEQMVVIGEKVAEHVQACFAKESVIDAQIRAGTITTVAEIDEAFADLN